MKRDGLLRIGEVARRAGVARGTIQHYLREGLLPAPIKTFRNMAYYEPDCVDRIRAIKDLQERSHMPLAEIRKLLGAGTDRKDLAHALMGAQKAALDAISPPVRASSMTPAQAARAFGLAPKLLDELVGLELLTLRDGAFTRMDLEVLGAVAHLKRIGFTERAGFRPRDLLIYKDALSSLLEQEVRTFVTAAAERGGVAATPELARVAVEGATMLLLALRRKLVVDLLEMAAETLRPPAALEAKARRRRAS